MKKFAKQLRVCPTQIRSNMKFSNKTAINKGMTIPELVMATFMMIAFMGVFVLVTKFTANFMRPINLDGNKDFELSKDSSSEKLIMRDILNDHFRINATIDSIISTLSEPGVSSSSIKKLECTERPDRDWGIDSIDETAIPTKYSICITHETMLFEDSYENLLSSEDAKPGIYIIYAKPDDGITYNSAPLRRIFCRPKPFC